MRSRRALLVLAGLLTSVSFQGWAQIRPPVPPRPPLLQSAAAEPALVPAPPHAKGLVSAVTLADIGFLDGLRFANLGGRRELFVPLPQSGDIAASELVLVLDDVSAHDARRNLEVLVNDRNAVSIVLDGKTRGRVVHVPLARTRAKDGYLKLSFLYSGAATLDRCIDVRYVGDSLTIRPETAVEVDIGAAGTLDVATTAALMPRDVALVLPGRTLAPAEIATALTVARGLIASGRRVTFQQGFDKVADLAKRADPVRWSRGVILFGTLPEVASTIDAPIAKVAGAVPAFGMLAAVRVGGAPSLLVSDGNAVRAGRLFSSPSLAATRGIESASVGDATPIALPSDRVTFDQLGVAPAEADVFGRAELTSVIDIRRLPGGTKPARLLLDVMVAPDGAGEKAVVSAFVNERMLGSTVASTGEATHLDLPLPDGLVGANANIRALVQRASAQGDCRFEPQGYPAQILGSSALVLAAADSIAHDFSDLAARWSSGIELDLPASVADRPAPVLGLLAQALSQFSPDVAPIKVALYASDLAPAPAGAFLAVSERPPEGSSPRVRFDRGRVAVADRSGRTILDLGGFTTGAVAQVVAAGAQSGLWIKPLAADGSVPAPADLRLDRGDVAFLDATGVALAMSTERDTVVRIFYPDQVSWLTVAERFRPWIFGGMWLFATAAVLLVLQRMLRRRPANAAD
jgi:hypothetical protein